MAPVEQDEMDDDPDSGLDGDGESSAGAESPFVGSDVEAEGLALGTNEWFSRRRNYPAALPGGGLTRENLERILNEARSEAGSSSGGLTNENLARILNEDRSEAGSSGFYHLSLRGSAGLDGGPTVPSHQGQPSRAGSERGPIIPYNQGQSSRDDSEGGPVVPFNQGQPSRPASESGVDQQGEQMTISLRGHRSQSI